MSCKLQVMACHESLAKYAGQTDLIFTSPPYNVGKNYKDSDDLLLENEYRAFMHDFFSEAYTHARPGTRMVVNLPILFKDKLGRTYPVSQTIMPLAYLQPAEWKWHAEIVWSKYGGKNEERPAPGTAWGSFCNPSAPSIRTHTERIYVLYKDTWKRTPARADLCGEIIDRTDFARCTHDIWTIHGVTRKEHPAVMPHEIARRVINLFSFPGDTVLDPFCGIGTVPLVAAAYDRAAIGTDLSPAYIDQAHLDASGEFIETEN